MSVIHLRDIPGVKPAHIRLPGATHEVIVEALDPALYEEHDGRTIPEKGFGALMPPNLVEQFIVSSDRDAVRLCELVARAFVDGMLNPDTDWRSHTERSIQITAQCLREGRHAEN